MLTGFFASAADGRIVQKLDKIVSFVLPWQSYSPEHDESQALTLLRQHETFPGE